MPKIFFLSCLLAFGVSACAAVNNQAAHNLIDVLFPEAYMETEEE